MGEPRQDPRGLAALVVRQRDGRQDGQQGQRGADRRGGRRPGLRAAHATPRSRIATRWIVQNAPSVPTR
jgi:hypothetical protein